MHSIRIILILRSNSVLLSINVTNVFADGYVELQQQTTSVKKGSPVPQLSRRAHLLVSRRAGGHACVVYKENRGQNGVAAHLSSYELLHCNILVSERWMRDWLRGT